MKNNLIRLLCFVIILSLMLFTFSGCSKQKLSAVNTGRYSEEAFEDMEMADTGVICENDRYVLSWDDYYMQVEIADKQSGKVYSTMPSSAKEITYDEDGYELKNNPLVESPIVVYYYMPKIISESNANAASEAIYDGEVYTEIIDNGIRVIYDFVNIEISVPVEYTIADDHFDITVHPEQITDNGENFVTAVSIAPFLVSNKNDSQDSYLFYPDGSGTLIKPDTIDFIGQKLSKRVYGDDMLVYDFKLNSYEKGIKMPVFGAKEQDNAILGIITSGAEQAFLDLNVGAENVGYSSVYPFFRIRGYNYTDRPQRLYIAEPTVTVFDEVISETPLSIAYYTLSGDKANYNGMAETYRDYLIKNGMLVDNENSEAAVSLEVLGGVEQTEYTFGIPHTVLKSLTTLEQANDIGEYFAENIDGKILMNLVGFGQSGLDIGKVGGGFKIPSVLGNKKKAVSLSDFCKDNGIELFMDFDIVKFSSSGSGFSTGSDSAKLHNGQTAYLYTLDNVTRNETDERYVLLSRDNLSSALDKSISSLSKYKIEGISLASLTGNMYSDYSTEGARVGGGMASTVSGLLKTAAKENTVLSNNANVYAAGYSDYITNTPTHSSQADIYWCDIPFYQMIFKGYVPMSSEAINLSSNENTMILRCIETGVSPSFTLLYDYKVDNIVADFSSLYGSKFNGIKENAVSITEEVQSVLSKIDGAKIIKHTVLDNGLRVTVYDNGFTVAVNYTDKALEYNGYSIEAESYKIWEG